MDIRVEYINGVHGVRNSRITYIGGIFLNYKRVIALIMAAVLTIGSMSMVYGDSPFGDIENNWAKANIISVYEKGLMGGTSQGKFSPDVAMEKYSAIITIARMMNAEKVEDLDALVGKYKAVLEGYEVPIYARKEVAFVLDKEIIQGEIDLIRFNDEPNATKLDICIYLGRAFGIEHDPSKYAAQLFFVDTEDIPRAYRIYVDHMIKIGVVDGKGDANGYFKPNDPVTRAMFAKMLDVASNEYAKQFGEASENTDYEAPDNIEPIQDGDVREPSEEITDKIDYVSDTASSTTAKGTIDSIIYSRNSKPKVILEVEGQKMMEFYMPEDLIKENVIINGQLSDVYSLRPGMQVEVKAENGEIRNLATIEITRTVDDKAIIKSIDLLSAIMVVDILDENKQTMEEKKVYLRDAKIGDLSLNILTMDLLKPGQSIQLYGVEDVEGIKARTVILQQ